MLITNSRGLIELLNFFSILTMLTLMCYDTYNNFLQLNFSFNTYKTN
jgi:hypothetical protein